MTKMPRLSASWVRNENISSFFLNVAESTSTAKGYSLSLTSEAKGCPFHR